METPTFKELLKADVHNIFLNPAEFGERHRVKSNMDGIYTRQLLFYVAADDFGEPLPGQDTYLQLDGGTYKVVDATDECGIYAITLEANRSR